MLTYAAGQFGSTSWYGDVKTTQELARDAFDAININKAFAWWAPGSASEPL